MENNVEARADNVPPGIGCLTAQAAPSCPNGDPFNAAFACRSSANLFKDQLGDDSEDLFNNLVRQFGDELKDAKLDAGSESPGGARKSSLPTGDKVCPEIVTEQKVVNHELKEVDFVTIHGRCNGNNSNGAYSSGRADGILAKGAPPPKPRPDMALDPKMGEPEKGAKKPDYIKDSLEQFVLGN
jgi:hypothetical protein